MCHPEQAKLLKVLEFDHIVPRDDIKVLGRESNHWLLEIKESLFIKREKP